MKNKITSREMKYNLLNVLLCHILENVLLTHHQSENTFTLLLLSTD